MAEPTSPAPLAEIDGGAVRIAKAAPAELVRVIVAYIDDEPITVPKEIPGGLTLDMLRVYQRRGTRAAAVFMVEEALGAEQVEKLSACDGMTQGDLKALMEKVGKLYQGQVDELLGN